MRKRCIWQAQGSKTFGQQLFKIDFAFKRGLAKLLVSVRKTRLDKPHVRRQFSKYLRIGFGLAQRRNGRAVQQHVGMAVRGVNVPVF